MFFEGFFKELNRRRIKHLVIGGVAVNLHGYPRVTGDLDIMISLDPQNALRFVEMIKKMGWRPRAPVPMEDFADFEKRSGWIRDKGMKVFQVYNPKNEFEHVDVMVESYINFKAAFEKRERIPAGCIRLSVISIPDLIRLKRIAGRPRDLIDIGALEQILKEDREKTHRRKKLRI